MQRPVPILDIAKEVVSPSVGPGVIGSPARPWEGQILPADDCHPVPCVNGAWARGYRSAALGTLRAALIFKPPKTWGTFPAPPVTPPAVGVHTAAVAAARGG